MHLSFVNRPRGALAFQVILDDDSVAATSGAYAEREGAMRAMEVFLTCLREGVGAERVAKGGQHRLVFRGEDGEVLAESVARAAQGEIDALLVTLQTWAATTVRYRVTFPPEQRSGASATADLRVAIRYDLEERSRSGQPGVELLRRARDSLYCAHINDASGVALVFLRGFPGRYSRDEQVRAALAAASEGRRYRRLEAEGRNYFVLLARNGREIARSRWFAAAEEREAAIAWLLQVAPVELSRQEGAKGRRRVAAGYHLERASTSGASGFERFRGEDQSYYFHVNDRGGRALIFSHGYSSARERDGGIRTFVGAGVLRDCYQVRGEGELFYFVVLAANGRELARSRAFQARAEAEAAIAWVLGELRGFGGKAGVRRRETMEMTLPIDAGEEPERAGSRGAEEDADQEEAEAAGDGDEEAGEEASVVAEARPQEEARARGSVEVAEGRADASAGDSAPERARGGASSAPSLVEAFASLSASEADADRVAETEESSAATRTKGPEDALRGGAGPEVAEAGEAASEVGTKEDAGRSATGSEVAGAGDAASEATASESEKREDAGRSATGSEVAGEAAREASGEAERAASAGASEIAERAASEVAEAERRAAEAAERASSSAGASESGKGEDAGRSATESEVAGAGAAASERAERAASSAGASESEKREDAGRSATESEVAGAGEAASERAERAASSAGASESEKREDAGRSATEREVAGDAARDASEASVPGAVEARTGEDASGPADEQRAREEASGGGAGLATGNEVAVAGAGEDARTAVPAAKVVTTRAAEREDGSGPGTEVRAVADSGASRADEATGSGVAATRAGAGETGSRQDAGGRGDEAASQAGPERAGAAGEEATKAGVGATAAASARSPASGSPGSAGEEKEQKALVDASGSAASPVKQPERAPGAPESPVKGPAGPPATASRQGVGPPPGVGASLAGSAASGASHPSTSAAPATAALGSTPSGVARGAPGPGTGEPGRAPVPSFPAPPPTLTPPPGVRAPLSPPPAVGPPPGVRAPLSPPPAVGPPPSGDLNRRLEALRAGLVAGRAPASTQAPPSRGSRADAAVAVAASWAKIDALSAEEPPTPEGAERDAAGAGVVVSALSVIGSRQASGAVTAGKGTEPAADDAARRTEREPGAPQVGAGPIRAPSARLSAPLPAAAALVSGAVVPVARRSSGPVAAGVPADSSGRSGAAPAATAVERRTSGPVASASGPAAVAAGASLVAAAASDAPAAASEAKPRTAPLATFTPKTEPVTAEVPSTGSRHFPTLFPNLPVEELRRRNQTPFSAGATALPLPRGEARRPRWVAWAVIGLVVVAAAIVVGWLTCGTSRSAPASSSSTRQPELQPEASAPEPVAMRCPTEVDATSTLGILTVPQVGVAGRPVRILAADLTEGASLSVALRAEGGRVEEVPLTARPGVPSTVVAAWTPTASGTYVLVVGRQGRGLACQELRVEASPAVEPAGQRPSEVVWSVERAWTPVEEALYSGWIREMFAAAPGEEPTWSRLDEVTADPRRNILFDPDEDPTLQLRPDGADLPYFLRAYWAYKRRLPFAFRNCSRGRGDEAPRCSAPRSNLNAGEAAGAGQVQRFFQRTLASGVQTGNVRTGLEDPESDFDPVAIDAQALRPGAVYADPHGHVLVLADRVPATKERSGVLFAVDAQPDGTITRERFWEGTFLFSPDRTLGGTGFKRFRPVALGPRGEVVQGAGEADPRTGYTSLTVEQFYEQVDALLNPQPRDPFAVQREVLGALDDAVRSRVEAVERAAASAREGRATVAMPSGFEVFEATGAWEKFSSPGRDMRLLIAVDVARSFAERASRRPEAFVAPSGATGPALAAALSAERERELRERRFEYRRSDGSAWSLSLADLIDRAGALEVGYNPNDCPEVRWGAPARSEEASTCRSRAPREQRVRMEEYRRWFRARRVPRRGP